MTRTVTRISRTAVAAILAALASAAPASAWTLGVGDRADAPAAESAQLGARVYRVVIDPDLPLASYDARIVAHRAAGQEPQLVVGGTGTRNHASSRGVVRAAVAVAKRWPSAFSVGVINEPNESGMGLCEYERTWLAAYSSLRAVGVKRVPFGEWSPNQALVWHEAALNPHRCHGSAPRVAKRAKLVAWHGYGVAIDFGGAFRLLHRKYHAVSPRLYVTEAGAVLRFRSNDVSRRDADLMGLRYWRRALRAVKRDKLVELVAWDVHSPHAASAWDSSLIEPGGRTRPAFDLLAHASRR